MVFSLPAGAWRQREASSARRNRRPAHGSTRRRRVGGRAMKARWSAAGLKPICSARSSRDRGMCSAVFVIQPSSEIRGDSIAQLILALGSFHGVNMINMIGVAVFITIPALMTRWDGPQALIGWLIALVTDPRRPIWAELARRCLIGRLTTAFAKPSAGRPAPAHGVSVFVWQIASATSDFARGGLHRFPAAREAGIAPDQHRMRTGESPDRPDHDHAWAGTILIPSQMRPRSTRRRPRVRLPPGVNFRSGPCTRAHRRMTTSRLRPLYRDGVKTRGSFRDRSYQHGRRSSISVNLPIIGVTPWRVLAGRLESEI